jgi:diguanylate cyclase (GGDEF)-like protein/PAS domain S-box-containing protein
MAATLTGRAATTRAATALTAVAVLATAYTAGSVLHWGFPRTPGDGAADTVAALVGDFDLSAVAALAALSCAARGLAGHGRQRASWLLFSASALVAGTENGVWGWHEFTLRHPPPTASDADWLLLFLAPFAMAGMLVHHRGPGSAAGWIKLALDGVLIAGALFTVGWPLAAARADGGSSPQIALGLAHAVFDVLLVGLLITLRLRGRWGDGASMAVLLAGYCLVVLSDAFWAVPSVRVGDSSGELVDSGWFTGYLLLAVAPWMSVWTPGAQRPWRRIPAAARAWVRRALYLTGLILPYAAGALCLGCILFDGLGGDHRVHPAVLAGGAAVLAVLVTRQGVCLMEKHRLMRQLALREDHFRSLVQASSDVIVTVDPLGRLGYISPAMLHVFGYEPELLMGTSLYRLVHPDERQAVGGAIRHFLAGNAASESIVCRIQAAHPVPADGGASPWRDAECTLTRHRGGLVFTCRDVSDRVALQQQLAYSAYHDSLTGLPNRALFTERLEQALARRSASADPVAVLFLDLDWFKEVNDAGGHAAGDALLVEVAARLRASVRGGDTVARFGGDEFAALLQQGPNGRDANDVAGRVHAALTRPYLLLDGRFVIGASIGMAFWRPGVSAAELMREADLAMYDAKAGGKGSVVIRDLEGARDGGTTLGG